MASQTITTTDHDEIREWVEDHDGAPASVAGTERGGEEAGVLRIDFPGGAGEPDLEHISWDEWFAKFDESGLAFLYQEEKASGEDSTFFKLVAREGDAGRRASADYDPSEDPDTGPSATGERP